MIFVFLGSFDESRSFAGVSFTPKEVGDHLVNVYEKGIDIVGSPFKINVKNEEVGDANKVKVYGKGLENGFANQINEFTIDTRDAGKLTFSEYLWTIFIIFARVWIFEHIHRGSQQGRDRLQG